jgi:hypothetical protein
MGEAMKRAWFVIVCGLASATAPTLVSARDGAVMRAKDAAPHAKSAPAAISGKAASAPARRLRKVAVAQFDAPSDSRARYGVLNELSEHDDVEVVSLDDIRFAAQRFKLGAEGTEGRAKISAALGVEVWIDGKASSDSAQLTLSKPDGKLLVETDVKAPSEKLLESLTGERMWASMGALLSPREEHRRMLLAQNERAHQKLEARELEQEHQQKLVLEAKQKAKHDAEVAETARKQKLAEAEHDHQKKLAAQQAVAIQKRAAWLGYLSHQTTLAEARKGEQKRSAEAEHRAQLAAAEATKQQEIAAQHARAQAEVVAQAQETGAYVAPATYGYGSAPAYGNAPATAYAKPSGYSRPTTAQNGISPATQRWLAQQQQQQQYYPPSNQLPAAQAPSMVPARPGYAANGGGISPATQRWLAEQQQQQQLR